MTFGRPAAIPDSYVKLELPVSFPAPETTRIVHPQKPDSVCFFSATIKLYKVTWHVIEGLYGQNIGSESMAVNDTVFRVLNLENQLLEWERSLPQNLHLKHSSNLAVIPEDASHHDTRLATVLTLRYHNTRLLLHRPILVKYLNSVGSKEADKSELALLLQIGASGIQACLNSASEIVSIVDMAVHSIGVRRTFLGAWWFTLYYSTYHFVLMRRKDEHGANFWIQRSTRLSSSSAASSSAGPQINSPLPHPLSCPQHRLHRHKKASAKPSMHWATSIEETGW